MADGNANLSCILVDDATYSASNWLSIDSASTFVESQNACDALSINEFGKLSFSVYPNPANTHFSLQGNFKIKNIELFSVLGNLVKRFEFTQDKYAIDSLESGLYLVKITTHNNGVFTYKLIKE
ncbi:MAG: T9SS type A sorting domain-containing protein, partial [Flavobacteriaceae bacterium]